MTTMINMLCSDSREIEPFRQLHFFGPFQQSFNGPRNLLCTFRASTSTIDDTADNWFPLVITGSTYQRDLGILTMINMLCSDSGEIESFCQFHFFGPFQHAFQRPRNFLCTFWTTFSTIDEIVDTWFPLVMTGSTYQRDLGFAAMINMCFLNLAQVQDGVNTSNQVFQRMYRCACRRPFHLAEFQVGLAERKDTMYRMGTCCVLTFLLSLTFHLVIFVNVGVDGWVKLGNKY